MDGDSRLTAQLAPFEAALMAAARAQAGERLQAGQAQAEAARADGETRARALLDNAVAEGRRAAERAAARRLVDGRRRARELVLRAQNDAYQRLLADARSAAAALCTRPEYPDLERRLVETAHAVLGKDAAVTRNPDGRGGVRASRAGCALDLTLPVLVRRCVERLGEEVARLWA
jgi:hypothetical protein